MEIKPLIKQGWLRALLFAICFLVLIILSNIAVDRISGNIQLNKPENGETNNLPGLLLLIRVSFSLLISVLTVYFFRRMIDKQNLISLGLQVKNNLSSGAAGLFLGFLLLSAGTLLLVADKNLVWTGINFDPAQLTTGFAVMIIVAFAEELAFRGYILNNLMQSMNKWLALTCTALLFAVSHINNPGANPVALINVFLGGLLLGINYIFTNNLWFGILFHFSWNFYQGSILGYKVSGVSLKSLFEQELNGNSLLTGGPFGFEGSVIAGVLSLLAILSLALINGRRIVNV